MSHASPPVLCLAHPLWVLLTPLFWTRSALHRLTLAQCVIHTPPLMALLLQPSELQILFFAPCVKTHTSPDNNIGTSIVTTLFHCHLCPVSDTNSSHFGNFAPRVTSHLLYLGQTYYIPQICIASSPLPLRHAWHKLLPNDFVIRPLTLHLLFPIFGARYRMTATLSSFAR